MTVARDPETGVPDPSHSITDFEPRDPTAPLPGLSASPGPDNDGAPESGGWQQRAWQKLRRRSRRGIVAGLVIGVMFGLLSGELMARGPTTWSSQTVMFFNDPLGIAMAGDPGELAKLTALRYKYASLAATEAMAAPVAAELKVPVSEVLASASVVVPPNSLLLQVDGSSQSPTFASRVAMAMSQEIIQYVQSENKTFNIPAADQVLVSVVSPTTTPTASRPSRSKAAGIGLIVFLGGFVVAFVAYQLLVDPRRSTSR